MAQMTRDLAKSILAGSGCTRWEVEQLCMHYLKTTGEQSNAPAGSGEAVEYQYRELPDGEWRYCDRATYEATLQTGRYGGHQYGPKCETSVLYAHAPPAQDAELREDAERWRVFIDALCTQITGGNSPLWASAMMIKKTPKTKAAALRAITKAVDAARRLAGGDRELPDGEWRDCSRDTYIATMQTGIYEGIEHAPKCEARALYAHAPPAQDAELREDAIALAKYIIDHPHAAKGMGADPHGQWQELQRMARRLVGGGRSP